MLRKLINRILAPRHPWRTVSFSELSELYISSMLRDFAQSMVGIFIPVYLYSYGFTVPDVLFYFALFYAFGAFGINDVVGRLVARFGAKHIISASFFLQVISFLMLASLPEYGWPLWSLAFVARIASVCYYLSFHVDFSKVKHKEHGGKELGFINIVSKIASVVGPVIGGVVATLFGSQSILIVASVVFGIAIIPLMTSQEPMKTRQKFAYKGMPIKKIRRALAVSALSNLENSFVLWLWPLYVSIFIFANEPYLKLGIAASVGTAVSVIAALAVGQLIDNKKAHELFKLSIFANSFLHFVRLLAAGFRSVIFINVINDSVTTACRMTFMKGYYDSADDVADYRIEYITLTENVVSVTRGLAWAILGFAALQFQSNQKDAVAAGFVLAAVVSLLVLFQRFPALQKQR